LIGTDFQHKTRLGLCHSMLAADQALGPGKYRSGIAIDSMIG
jgi:hypothetical protein